MEGRGFDLSENRVDDRVVIAARGEIDLATVGTLNAALAQAIESGAPDVWLDLTKVDFMDSTGLTAIVRAHDAMDAGRSRLAVICPPGPVRRAFEITGLDARLPLFADRAAASAPAAR
jgi:anti-sigma B factor antagonist